MILELAQGRKRMLDAGLFSASHTYGVPGMQRWCLSLLGVVNLTWINPTRNLPRKLLYRRWKLPRVETQNGREGDHMYHCSLSEGFRKAFRVVADIAGCAEPSRLSTTTLQSMRIGFWRSAQAPLPSSNA